MLFIFGPVQLEGYISADGIGWHKGKTIVTFKQQGHEWDFGWFHLFECISVGFVIQGRILPNQADYKEKEKSMCYRNNSKSTFAIQFEHDLDIERFFFRTK